MNREIKFRIWSEKHKAFFSNSYVHDITVSPCDGKVYWLGDNATDDFILLQYTGLKNSDGTEIYEGDILEIRNLYESPKVAQVVYKDGMIALDDGDECSYLADSICHADVVEVIGNIYENPELLEGD